MNKRKVFLAILLTLVLLFTVALTAACKDPDTPPEPGDGEQGTWTLQKIALSGSYKTEYQLNEQFSSAGLTVTATMVNTATKDTRMDDVSSQVTVNSDNYHADMVGGYVITVSYTNANVTRYASYTVKAMPYQPAVDGITMTKSTVEYSIPDGKLAINVNVDDIVVKAVDDKGAVSETALAANEYTLAYFKGATKLDNLEHATRGAYTIQAESKADGQKAFVIVDVLGGIDGITADTTRTEVELANDEATAVINTQDITVKTDGGAAVVVNETAGPCTKIDYKLYSVAADKTETLLDTWTVGAGTYKVKVTATYILEEGADTIDFTAEVTITVKVKSNGPRTETYNLDLSSFDGKSDKANLTQADFTGNNAFLTTLAGTLQYRNDPVCLEIKKDALSVTFEGTGTITISARSTNGTNLSSLYLKDSKGNYLTATYDTTLTSTGVVAQDKGNVYTVYGSTICALTFTVTEPGTYIIGNMNVTVGTADTNRNTRIMAIEMIDNIEN